MRNGASVIQLFALSLVPRGARMTRWFVTGAFIGPCPSTCIYKLTEYHCRPSLASRHPRSRIDHRSMQQVACCVVESPRGDDPRLGPEIRPQGKVRGIVP